MKNIIIVLLFGLVTLKISAFYQADDQQIYLSEKDVNIDKYITTGAKIFGLYTDLIKDSTFVVATIRLKSESIKSIQFLVVSAKTGKFRSPIELRQKELKFSLIPVPDDLFFILQSQYEYISYWLENMKTDINCYGFTVPNGERWITLRYILIPQNNEDS